MRLEFVLESVCKVPKELIEELGKNLKQAASYVHILQKGGCICPGQLAGMYEALMREIEQMERL